jgi:hypothetical protein
MFSPKPKEETETTKQNIPTKKNVSTKKKPSLSVSSADESVDFSVHFKNKILTIYLYINKKGVKESWKAKLNETEMNKLLYNLFLIFNNPELFQQELQAVYPDQQLEQVLHVNPNRSISLENLATMLASK